MWYGLICTLWYVSEYLSWMGNVYLLILGKKYWNIKSRQKVVVTWHVTESALNMNVYSVTFIKKVLLFVVCICWVYKVTPLPQCWYWLNLANEGILTCREYFRFYVRFRWGPVGGFITQPTHPELAKRSLSGTPPSLPRLYIQEIVMYFSRFISAPILWNLGAGCHNYKSIPNLAFLL